MATNNGSPAFGVGIPNFGAAPSQVGLGAIASSIEEAGFDGAWVFDHVVLMEGARSSYPYSDDGTFFLEPDGDWYECLTTLAFLAAATEKLQLGVGVCILPLRDPILLAKQCATIDQLSGGRLRLGVGTGWMAEEFEALGIAFDDRGRRRDGALALLRQCWTGAPAHGDYGPFTIPAGVHCRPTPVTERVPTLVGGVSRGALRACAQAADGWIGAVPADGLPVTDLVRIRETLEEECAEIGRDLLELDLALRIAVSDEMLDSTSLEDLLAAYHQEGISTLIVDFGWRTLDRGRDRLERLAVRVSALRSSLRSSQ